MNPDGDIPGTLPQWVQYGKSYLADHNVPNARNNAEWMLCHVLGRDRLDLYTASVQNGDWCRDYQGALERRANREPLQHILGTTEFMSLVFETPPGVFVPRPETEVLVEAVERRLREFPLDGRLDVMDLCCGTGVIGISVAARIPNLTAVAVDRSEAAVTATRQNALRNGVADRVTVVCSEAETALDDRRYTAILCNPPYIETGDLVNLPPEVRDHEPVAALDGGADGLDFYRRVIPLLPPRLCDGGFVAFEIGDTQAAAVGALLRDAGFRDVSVIRDLARLPRVLLSPL
jgi:release factor glutamine methyltransferase